MEADVGTEIPMPTQQIPMAAMSTPAVASVAATAAATSNALVAAPLRLGPDEVAIVANQRWLRQPMVVRTTRTPSNTATQRIVKALEDNRMPFGSKIQLIVQTAMQDPELWNKVRVSMHVNEQIEQTRLHQERKRSERALKDLKSAHSTHVEYVRSQRSRILRSANTDEVRAEHLSRGQST